MTSFPVRLGRSMFHSVWVYGLVFVLGGGTCAKLGWPAEESPQTAAETPSPEPVRPAMSGYGATAEPDVAVVASDRAAERLGLDLKTDAPLDIKARTLDLIEESTGDRIRFRGDVQLVQGALTLRCDTLDAYYPGGAGSRAQRIVARGRVRVTQGDVELRCARAVFDESSCVTTCGSSESCESTSWPETPAALRRGEDIIEGRQLDFNLCTGELAARCGARLRIRPPSGSDASTSILPGKDTDAGKGNNAAKTNAGSGAGANPGGGP